MAVPNTCLKIYQVDAFAAKVFEGNPAAVIPLTGPDWPEDTKMQAIARENNLSETAFLIAKDASVLDSNTCAYKIRWFTPNGEVDLCGHATLGSAYVVFRFLASAGKDKIEFDTTKSGTLYVSRENVVSDDTIGLLRMDFPADIPTPVVATASISIKLVSDALGGADVLELVQGKDDLLAIVADENVVKTLEPNFSLIANLLNTTYRGLTVSAWATSASTTYNCHSRSFFPTLGVNEDPVCGSAHCLVASYWAKAKGVLTLEARQESLRGGDLHIELNSDISRVSLSGKCAMYMEGKIWI